jgi:hypothetical protein
VVGRIGAVARASGDRWTRQVTPTRHELEAVWIAPGGTIWAVGTRGTILRAL